MKTIVFLHGFGSSGATKTSDYLREKLTDTVVISPDIPLEPKISLKELNKLCHDVNPDVIIGTSMGDGKKTWEGLSKEAYIDSCVKVPMRYVFPLRNYSV